MSAQTIPQDLREILNAIAVNEANAKKVMAGLSHTQFNWQRQPDKTWSIAQCLDHLTLANHQYLRMMTPAIAAANPLRMARKGPIQPGFFSRLFMAAQEPPVKFKVPAPGKIHPRSNGDPEQVWAEWVKTHDQLRSLITQGASLDLNRVKMKNPFVTFFSLPVGTALLVLAAHERRHIWQAGEVRKAI